MSAWRHRLGNALLSQRGSYIGNRICIPQAGQRLSNALLSQRRSYIGNRICIPQAGQRLSNALLSQRGSYIGNRICIPQAGKTKLQRIIKRKQKPEVHDGGRSARYDIGSHSFTYGISGNVLSYFYAERRALAALKIHAGHNANMLLSESLRRTLCKDVHNLVPWY
jgi:hypothetical protein